MKEHEVFVSIRSKDRNMIPLTNSSKYSVNLPRLFQNVTKIEYIDAEIPNTLLPDNKRKFFFKAVIVDATNPALVSNVTCVVPLKNGMWESSLMCAFMTNNIFILNSFDVSNLRLNGMFSFGYDNSTFKMYVQCLNPSCVTFFQVTAGTDEGFGFIQDQYIPMTSNGRFYATFPMNFDVPNFLYLCVEELRSYNTSEHLMVPISNKTDTSIVMARIQMNADTFHWVVQSPNAYDLSRKSREDTVCNLSKLTISWVDPFGHLVDFNGVDHTLLLRLTYIE